MKHYTHNNCEQSATSAEPFKTIVSLANYHGESIPEKQFIQWLDRGNIESDSYTYAELDTNARSLAVAINNLLATNETSPNKDNAQKVALIVVQPGLSFVVSFFACLYAGVIAVPTYPPKKNETLNKLGLLACDAKADLIITDKVTAPLIGELRKQVSGIKFLLSDEIDKSLAGFWRYPEITENSVAFYQYTSGSTGTPKGVVISHCNLMSNQQIIAEAMNHDSQTVVVGWLPMFHDMGLIGNLLQPFYLGARCILMSPSSFIMNPIRWLEAISKYKATVSGGPNFAYDLCISRTTEKQRKDLDLSSWKIAFNGSEPIRIETLNNFSKTFSGNQFSDTAFYPCYGMAESTLLITGSSHNSSPYTITVDKQALSKNEVVLAPENLASESDAKNELNLADNTQTTRLVSSGIVYKECCVKIVDPSSNLAQQEGVIGEIWTKSDSVAMQYKGKPQLSKQTFNATIANEPDGSEYLRTGDLGFIHNSELFVTGRLKDLIIINGKNHYPQDIERTVLSADCKLCDCTAAAFSIDMNNREQLIVVLSIKKNLLNKIDRKNLGKTIMSLLTKCHGVNISDLVLSLTRLPLTSSGKIRRSICREMYLKNEFVPIND